MVSPAKPGRPGVSRTVLTRAGDARLGGSGRPAGGPGAPRERAFRWTESITIMAPPP